MLDIPAEDLTRVARMELAESALHAPAATFGGVEFSPDLARKTAVLAARLINNHPLPEGNRRVGDLYALEFVARNGGTWTYAPDDPDGDGTVAIIEGVASGEIDEGTLTSWIADRLAGSDDTPDYPTGSQRPLSPRHHRAVPRRLLPNEVTRGPPPRALAPPVRPRTRSAEGIDGYRELLVGPVTGLAWDALCLELYRGPSATIGRVRPAGP